VRAPYQFAPGQGPAATGISTGATRLEVADATPDSLLRDSEPFQLVSRDSRDRNSSFAQVSQVAASNPLQVLAQAGEAPGSLVVRLKSAGGQAESGTVQVTISRQKTLSIPYTLAAGQKEARLDVPGPVQNQARIFIAALDQKGHPSVRPRTLHFAALDSFSRPGAEADYGAIGDGDAKVASTQALAVAQAPAALGGQSVRALKLSYSWDAGWKFIRVLPPASLKIEGRPTALQVWIYGDATGNLARLRVRDESGQTFQPTGDPQAIDWTGWKLVSFALDGRNSGHWGGANDGIVHGSLAWDSVFLLDSASRSAQKGEIYLANPTLVYEDADQKK